MHGSTRRIALTSPLTYLDTSAASGFQVSHHTNLGVNMGINQIAIVSQPLIGYVRRGPHSLDKVSQGAATVRRIQINADNQIV